MERVFLEWLRASRKVTTVTSPSLVFIPSIFEISLETAVFLFMMPRHSSRGEEREACKMIHVRGHRLIKFIPISFFLRSAFALFYIHLLFPSPSPKRCYTGHQKTKKKEQHFARCSLYLLFNNLIVDSISKGPSLFIIFSLCCQIFLLISNLPHATKSS